MTLVKSKRNSRIIQGIFIIIAFAQLLSADCYYAPYLIFAAASLLCLFSQVPAEKRPFTKSFQFLLVFFSALFSAMITLADYRLWDLSDQASQFSIPERAFNLIIPIGTFMAFYNIFSWAAGHINSLKWKKRLVRKPLVVFILSFLLIVSVELSVLFFSQYPGNLSDDSINQLNQILTHQYSNHHPFYHTMLINLFFSIGFRLFHEINAAVAFYSFCSICIIVFIFSLSLAVMAEMGTPDYVLISGIIFYTLMPYHMMYSMTMWKDVAYGGSILLFMVLLFRYMEFSSGKKVTVIGILASGLGICLFRNNGFFVFLITTLFFFILFRKQYRKILFVIMGILLCAFILKHPVLKALGVSETELTEGLSIPIQQVARDVTDNQDLTTDERELLSHIVDVDAIPAYYTSYISDPEKELLSLKGNTGYITSHGGEFLRFYLKRILKHPFTYLKGWIDETRGYWNSGYDYWRWTDRIDSNKLGIHRTIISKGYHSFLKGYLNLFEESPFLQIFLSIGLFNWLVLILLFTAICKKDKKAVMMTIPLIATTFSLLIATPVFSEFRYDYAVFCSLPFLACLIFRPEDKGIKLESTPSVIGI